MGRLWVVRFALVIGKLYALLVVGCMLRFYGLCNLLLLMAYYAVVRWGWLLVVFEYSVGYRMTLPSLSLAGTNHGVAKIRGNSRACTLNTLVRQRIN